MSLHIRKILAAGLLAALPFGFGGAATAATLTETISGNDCSGVWNNGFNGFENCQSPDRYGNSPIIAKYDVTTGGGLARALNTNTFASIDGSEFNVSVSGNTVNWSYNAGAGDPIITVVAVKYGPRFDVWWDGGSAITGGSFMTASGQGISHVSFYDSNGGGGNPPPVPLPAGLPLVLTGLGIFGVLRHRRRKTA